MKHFGQAAFVPALARPLAPAEAPLELAVVIPTLNEIDNVQPLLDRLARALDGVSWEAVFVDDDSSDGTADLLRALGRTDLRVRVLQRVGRRGLASAVIEGMLGTAAPVLAVIDADMQHDESILPQLVAAVASGNHDLAVGTRYADGGSTGDWDEQRRLASRLATRLAGLVLKAKLSDPMSGFFVISRDALTAALPKLSTVGFKILLDLVASSPPGLRVREVPYTFRSRVAGESKLDSTVVVDYLMLLLDKLVGRYVPARFLMFAGVGGLGLGVHLLLLGLAIRLFASSFVAAQTLAVAGAMTFNFAVNNMLTYRDRRLRGWGYVRGLISFYAVCLVGAAANIGVGAYVYDRQFSWWLAGAAGAAIGAVWNYAVSSVVTWRK